eukprot:547818-Pyramimonas_sp.AAC.1
MERDAAVKKAKEAEEKLAAAVADAANAKSAHEAERAAEEVEKPIHPACIFTETQSIRLFDLRCKAYTLSAASESCEAS